MELWVNAPPLPGQHEFLPPRFFPCYVWDREIHEKSDVRSPQELERKENPGAFRTWNSSAHCCITATYRTATGISISEI